MTSFQDFGLADPISRALQEENYVTPTPIQAQTIPTALTGRDIVGIAQTGTGKTASFALPILHRLVHPRKQTLPKSCRVLVLSPTRELSGQILDSFQAYGRYLRISSALAIGGVPMGRQVRSVMQGVDVMVATPGRLLDLVRGNALKLGQVEFLVLDEADRMLDMGFINDIRKIVAKLPKDRQTLFFSATMPKAIAELAEEMLRDPTRVAVTPVSSTAERVTQRIIHVDRGTKAGILAKVLQAEPVNRALVFTRTKHGADKVVKLLAKSGIPADAIHGNKSQNHRERTMAAFRSGEIRTLVATDIAARGIDVDGVSHVVNFDLPNVPETYVHRIGRTARAGADGIAISLVDQDELPYLKDIEKLIRQDLPKEDLRTNDRRSHAERTGDTRDHQKHRTHQQRANDGRRQGQNPRNPGDGSSRPHGQRPQGAGRPAQGQRHAAGDTVPGGGQGLRRRRPGSNGQGGHPPSRHDGGQTGQEALQGVAFMARESRPARPQGQQRNKSHAGGRPHGARQPQR